MSSERYGYALSYKSAHAIRYEVDMFEITWSCPYPGQYLIPCRHIIAVALHKRLPHNEWIRRSCSKFLMNDYYNSLKNSSVRLVPLQNVQPDGVTVCPERKKSPGRPWKYRRKERAKTNSNVHMAKRPVGRPRRNKLTEPEGVIIPTQAGSKPTGLPSQTSETLPKGVTALISKKPSGRPGKTGRNNDYT
ncbi:hypothetical protein XU18_3963 [Perkinsela sp. CCAP 1560/4]|nr:hypothetical protein XU18_3963 [Perkinsela sp. CCAP 1560/4]|eukprot:KNH04905.1 hypothetical protein XU18_3963 [Perkinsela sp. CCAP 1560/4]